MGSAPVSYTVTVRRDGEFIDDTARGWLRVNATSNRGWSIPAWRTSMGVEPAGTGFRMGGMVTHGTVTFEDETDATLFAIWAGGRLDS